VGTTDARPGDESGTGRQETGPLENGAQETGAQSGPPVPRAVLVAAVIVPLLMLAVVLVLVRDLGDEASRTAATEPVSAVGVPSPDAESAECRDLVAALPESLGEAGRVALTEPAPPGTAAYRLPDAEPVIVRCGLPAPPTFTVGAALQEVNGVQWFNEPDPDPSVTSSTWVAVDRPRYVAVTLPQAAGTGPIQDLSDALTEFMAEVEPSPAPIG